MLKYKVVPKKDLINNSVKYYAQLAPVAPVSLTTIAENISRECTLTPHDVKAVLSALEEQILLTLRNGGSIRLGDLGSFRPTVTSRGANSKKEFTAKNITGVRVRFARSMALRHGLSVGHPSLSFLNLSQDATDGE